MDTEHAAPVTETAEQAVSTGFDLQAVLHNPETWIIVAFLIFFAIFSKLVLPLILKGLDGRALKIRDQLEQASKLRAQAEELLASYQAERAAKEKEAEAIIANAKADAEALRTRAAAELTQALERRSQQAMDKIARAEADATSFIRSQMIDIATKAAEDVVRKQLESGKSEDPAVAKAISAVERQIH